MTTPDPSPTLRVFVGRFVCAHPGCRHLITHFAGRTEHDDVWCSAHAKEATRVR